MKRFSPRHFLALAALSLACVVLGQSPALAGGSSPIRWTVQPSAAQVGCDFTVKGTFTHTSLVRVNVFAEFNDGVGGATPENYQHLYSGSGSVALSDRFTFNNRGHAAHFEIFAYAGGRSQTTVLTGPFSC